MNEFDQLFGNTERRSQRTRSMALLVMMVSSVLASFPSAASIEEEAFAHYQNSVDALFNGTTSLEATRTREEMLVILKRRTNP